jgi:hypothetical protein
VVVPLKRFLSCLKQKVWGNDIPSPFDVAMKRNGEEWKRVVASDIRHPIIVAPNGDIADGYHRAAKALAFGKKTIRARIFESWGEMESAVVKSDWYGRARTIKNSR